MNALFRQTSTGMPRQSLAKLIHATSLLCAGLALASDAQAARLALVIGNDNYQNVRVLQNARADAQTMASAFEKAGYTVVMKRDLDYKAMKDELRAFRRRVKGGDEVVLYFSGHGVQVGGDNFLLPIDVRSDNEDQVRDDAVALNAILADLRPARAALTLAIIDACRDNPFPRVAGRAIGGRGLGRAESATGEMVIYAAGEGQQALDRLGNEDRVRNGVFTRVFVKEMERTGVPVDQVLKRVRVEVNRLAQTVGHEQVPALYDQVLGTFYFYPPRNSAGTTAGSAASPAQPPSPPADETIAAAPEARPETRPEVRPAVPTPQNNPQAWDVARAATAVDRRFIAWSSSWSADRYVQGTAQISEQNCETDSCVFAGRFTFTRFGTPLTIPFAAQVRKQGDRDYTVERLCYQDSTSGMRDCIGR